MKKNLLRAEMRRVGDTDGMLAAYLGMSQSTFSHKINGHVEFVQSEIAKIKERYRLTARQVDTIFFS